MVITFLKVASVFVANSQNILSINKGNVVLKLSMVDLVKLIFNETQLELFCIQSKSKHVKEKHYENFLIRCY